MTTDRQNQAENEASPSMDIALVGMACRFPGAENPGEYWRLLREGRESLTLLSEESLRAAGVPGSLISHPDYVRAGMHLQKMEQFDPGFFGFSPLDGKILDPQHRHFLECTWEALEDAGYDPFRFEGAIGVFAGSGQSAYLPYNLLTNPELVADVGLFLLRHTGNDKDFLATRASYCFDLKGPSINVQTACSTSLVAVHLAAQSLTNGECDMALAGGVTIELPHHQGYLFRESEILSRDGHCRPFDASSGGTVFGSGAGVVVLKRLDDALADRDNIHAVIKASAVNNDGAGKVSYLAPSVDGQAASIHEALLVGDIDPRTVTFIEAHGTGTQLGDPIEVAALNQAYATGNAHGEPYCALGSVKSNIGHLDTAAGVASLIKVVLALKHRQLPATLHYSAPNPAIDFASSPFYVNSRLAEWDVPEPRRAGVSSLGVGGTNAHVIVEEAPGALPFSAGRDLQLLVLSARSEPSLLRARSRLSEHLDENPELELADAAWTLAEGRRPFRRRGFLIAKDPAEAASILDGHDRDRFLEATAPETTKKLCFMFAGGGTQYPGMGGDLYENEPVYRAAVDECLSLLGEFVDFDLRSLLYPTAGAKESAALELERPSRTLPALFATQYAQSRLWESWGLAPAALIGHSMGENTAACIAGVFGLRDALGLVALRGQLFEAVGAGSMLTVELGADALAPYLGSELSLAAVNAPGLSVASGPRDAVARLEQRLTENEIAFRRIRIDVAAHSSMLESILAPFGDYLRSIRLEKPRIPFISNLTGDWISDSDATDPDYWVRHLRNTVRFADGAGTILAAGAYAMLEIGPGHTLSSLAGLNDQKQADQAIVSSLGTAEDTASGLAHMLNALGRVWQAGVDVDWTRFYEGQKRRRVSLPTYAFDHIRCWIDPGTSSREADERARSSRPEDWMYQPVWERLPSLSASDLSAARVLIIAGADPLAEELMRRLAAGGALTRLVRSGDRLDLSRNGDYRIRWSDGDDSLHLMDLLRQDEWYPTHIVHLLALDLPDGSRSALDAGARASVFDSIFHLAQAAGSEDCGQLHLTVISRQSFQVAGERIVSPMPALAAGLVGVLQNEFTDWRCRLVDIERESPAADIALRLISEMTDSAAAPDLIALRGKHRFRRNVLRQPAGGGREAGPGIRRDGVYLITGGTGGLGLVAADTLAEHGPMTLVLLARRPLPDRTYWPQLVSQPGPESVILRKLQELEARGVRVVLETGDVTDESRMREIAARIQHLGPLNGIIHTAGVMDDALLLAKDIDRAAAVIAPKLQGTIILDKIFNAESLDFMILYSSTSALLALPGQSDYAAANSFLDSFAQIRRDEGANVISINWPAWRSVGMAAALAGGVLEHRLPAGRPVAHPMLDRCIEETPERSTWTTLFNLSDHWTLSEHRIKDGPALIPGSGFLEIARAAYADLVRSDGPVRITGAAFELPFIVEDDDRKMLAVTLEKRNGHYEFSLTSDFGDEVEHARGTIGPAEAVNGRLDLEGIRKRCNLDLKSFDDPDHHPFMTFGSRWRSLRQVMIGEREALIELELPQDDSRELSDYRLHPALLDMASAGAQAIIDGYMPFEEFYVPIGYGKLVFNGTFPQRLFSHVRYRPVESSAHSREIALLDIDACDESGEVFLSIRDFSMRRLPGGASLSRALQKKSDDENAALERALQLGIDPAEGSAALLHILARPSMSGNIVSTVPFDLLRRELHHGNAPPSVEPLPSHDADADPAIQTVETVMAQCPSVAEAVARSFMDVSGDRRLVAWFVPDQAHYVTMGEVRRHAREHLSAGDVPQQFVELDELPRAADGGIDRGQLLDPLAPRDTHIPPRTTTEKAIARIWKEALGVDRVGLSDNFFDLGGHSLLATRVILQIYKRMKVRLDHATMVLNTLEQTARELDSRTENVPDPDVVPFLPGQSEGSPPKASRGILRSLFGGGQSGKTN
jgi:acyl transferase domain-containing protein